MPVRAGRRGRLTKGLDVSLLTLRDSTTVPDPDALSSAPAEAQALDRLQTPTDLY